MEDPGHLHLPIASDISNARKEKKGVSLMSIEDNKALVRREIEA